MHEELCEGDDDFVGKETTHLLTSEERTVLKDIFT